MNESYDICVVGGGASGMVAAVAAAKENTSLKVCIIEKNKDLGRKLKATGNGRCNISNVACTGYEIVCGFLEELGIATKAQSSGRIYPVSEQAEEVVTAFLRALELYNIDIIENTSLYDISLVSSRKKEGTKESDLFLLNGKIKCKALILALGGKAGPQFGTVGDGYSIAKSLGHKICPTIPVLTPLETEPMLECKGVRSKVVISLLYKGDVTALEKGELQFTADGVSGIAVFNLSRYLRKNDKSRGFKDYTLEVDFLPDISEEDVYHLIKQRAERGVDPLSTLVHRKISEVIYSRLETVCHVNYKLLAALLKSFRIQVIEPKGWKKAQCTSGGVEIDQVDEKTMESIIVPGMFFAGEILNYDGPCGGYNLNYAWETGIKAGRGATFYISDKEKDNSNGSL